MEKFDLGGTDIINWTQTIVWEQGTRHLDATCPACGTNAAMPVRLHVRSPWPPHPEQPLVTCPGCDTAFHPTMTQPPYEAVLDPLVDVYLEQNAGIDVMAELLAAVDPTRARRYIEIGCGFGFLLDYARVAFGWEARGFDPGYSARAGRTVLGVDIEHIYLNTAADAGAESYDVALCAEVIEHVFQPESLLLILRDVLTADGTLLLTTPSASGIRPETQPGTLLSLLCPGYHYALYSPKGMEALLRRVGFTQVSVQDRGHTLRVAASKGPLQADLARPFDRRSYHDYLRTRIGTTDPTTPLGIGYRYRLLKELTNAGDYAGAQAALTGVAEACRLRWGIDLSDPAGLLAALSTAPMPASIDAYHDSYPFCLGSILYFQGILTWQADARLDLARVCFQAATLASERMRATLRIIGADDEESEELMWRSRTYVSHLLIWSEPGQAAEDIRTLGQTPSALLGERIPTRFLDGAQRQIFIDLVNLGQYAAADRLASPVEAALPSDGAVLASAAFAFGILSMNHRKAPRAAASWFEKAYAACRRIAEAAPAAAPGLMWSALYHQAHALADAGRKDEAAEALRPLLAESGDARLPAVDTELKQRARQLAGARRLPL